MDRVKNCKKRGTHLSDLTAARIEAGLEAAATGLASME